MEKTTQHFRLDPGAAVVLTMFAYGVLPAAAQNLFNTRAPVWANVQTETSALAAMLGQYLQLAMIGVVALVALTGIARLRVGAGLFAFLLPWVTMSVATVYMEHRFSYSSLIYPLVGLVAASLRKPLVALRTVGVMTSVLAFGSLLMGVLKPTAGLFAISATNDKSIIGDKLLAGPLYHPNSLGESLALGLPFISLIRSKLLRRASYAAVLFALVWTGSRTAMIATAVVAVAAAGWLIIKRSREGTMFAPAMLLGIYSLVIFVGPVIVARGLDSVSSFSGRGQIWVGSLDHWAESPWMGKGAHIYADLAKLWNNVGIGAFHGHNAYVTFLITSGILGAAALTVAYIASLVRGWKHGWVGLTGLAVWPLVFIADGWMEVPSDLYTPGTLSWAVWLPLAVVLSGSLVSKNGSEPKEARPLESSLAAKGLPDQKPLSMIASRSR